ncbi:MAG: CAP domain-containing protein [Geobacteraceae bacterium]|nr:CAP domain-containing protein [Geobacteraceae bacterium]
MINFRLFSILLITIFPAMQSGAATAAQAPVSAGSRIATTENYVAQKINEIRADHGLAPLGISGKLRTAARRQSTDMAANNFLAHVDSQGNDLRARLAKVGATGWSTVGENVGQSMGYRNNSDVIIEGWMKSPHHRDNILNGSFVSTGIGAAVAPDGTLYLTQVFMESGGKTAKAAEYPYKTPRKSSRKRAE